MLMTCHYPDLGSASDWFPRGTSDLKYYPDLGGHAISMEFFSSFFLYITPDGNTPVGGQCEGGGGEGGGGGTLSSTVLISEPSPP